MKLILSFCLLLAAVDAGAQEIKPCPAAFPVEAITLSPLPEGWIGVAPSELPLVSADATSGKPQPAADIGKYRKTRHGYEVVFNTQSTEPGEKWLSCRYGVGGHMALAQRLPDTTESCTISYYKRPAFNDHDILVACRAAPPKPAR